MLQFSPLQLEGCSRSQADHGSACIVHFPDPTSVLAREAWDILMKSTIRRNGNTSRPDAATLYFQTNPFLNHFSISQSLAHNQQLLLHNHKEKATDHPLPSHLDSSTKP